MRIKFNARVFRTVYQRVVDGYGKRDTALNLYQILNFNQTVDLPIKKLFSLSGCKIIWNVHEIFWLKFRRRKVFIEIDSGSTERGLNYI